MTESNRPTSAFDEETMIEGIGPQRWRTMIHPTWNIDTNPNGGYAISAMVRAAISNRADHPHPLSLNAQFLRPATPGREAEIQLEELRSGRRVSTLRLLLVQDDQVRLSLVATMGSLGSVADDTNRHRLIEAKPPPDLPDPQDCVDRAELAQRVDLPLLDRVEVRVDPQRAEAGSGSEAEMAGWIRLSDGRPTDVDCLPLFCDAFPPSIFTMWGQIGWVPTIELTTHIRRRPKPGWIRASFRTDDVVDGLLVEDGVLWDEDDNLVAQCRQLALLI